VVDSTLSEWIAPRELRVNRSPVGDVYVRTWQPQRQSGTREINASRFAIFDFRFSIFDWEVGGMTTDCSDDTDGLSAECGLRNAEWKIFISDRCFFLFSFLLAGELSHLRLLRRGGSPASINGGKVRLRREDGAEEAGNQEVTKSGPVRCRSGGTGNGLEIYVLSCSESPMRNLWPLLKSM
jgi:hypothetical protein